MPHLAAIASVCLTALISFSLALFGAVTTDVARSDSGARSLLIGYFVLALASVALSGLLGFRISRRAISKQARAIVAFLWGTFCAAMVSIVLFVLASIAWLVTFRVLGLG